MKYSQIILTIFLFIFLASICPENINAESQSGRASLAIGQTLNGFYYGSSFYAGTINRHAYHGESIIAGGLSSGIFLFSSLQLTTPENMPASRAMAINSISFWSALEGYLFSWIFNAKNYNQLLASSLFDGAMTGTAAYFTNNYYISSADSASINLFGLYGTILILETAAFLKPEPTGLAKYVITASVTGSLALGYYYAYNHEMSPYRSLKIGLYGLLGTFSGAGFAWVMYFKSKRMYYFSMLIGTAGGLLAGYFLTDEPKRENNRPFQKTGTVETSNIRLTLGSASW